MKKIDSQKSLTVLSYIFSIFFIILILFPMLYIGSLSLQSENSIYFYPPKILPPPGNSVSLVIDYSKYKDKSEAELKDIALKDSILSMYSIEYELDKSNISEVKVYGVIDGKTIYYSRAHMLMIKIGRAYGVYTKTRIAPQYLLQDDRYIRAAKDIGYTFNLKGVDKSYNAEKLGQDNLSSEVGKYLRTSFKINGDYKGSVVKQSYEQLFENYLYYFKMPQFLFKDVPIIRKYSFFAFMFNTVITFVWAVLCQVIITSITAYPLSKLLNKKVADAVLLFFLATLMIPFIAFMIPQVILIKSWGMYNTYAGMLLPWLLPAPFYVFLYKGFFDRIPSAYFDAARIDGANELYTFIRVCMPMSKPIIVLIALQSFISGWTDFMWYYLIANKSSLWTLNVAVYSISQFANIKENFLMGLSVVTILPVILVTAIFSKHLKQSIMASGIKG